MFKKTTIKNISSPSLRFLSKHKYLLLSTVGNFNFFKKFSSGRSFGRVVVKTSNTAIKFKNKYPINYFYFSNNRTAYISKIFINFLKPKILVKTNNNKFYTLPKIQFVTPGQLVHGWIYSDSNYTKIKFKLNQLLKDIKFFINLYLPLTYYTANFYICFLGKYNPIYAKANGSKILLFSYAQKHTFCNVVLPSGVVKYVSVTYRALLGYTSAWAKLYNYGKCGNRANMGAGYKVRGVAKNPVDHPNGGRCKSKTPELSPWGWVAKKGK